MEDVSLMKKGTRVQFRLESQPLFSRTTQSKGFLINFPYLRIQKTVIATQIGVSTKIITFIVIKIISVNKKN